MHELGVIAAGNFSITAAMAQAASLLVAPYLPYGEVIDYASAASGTRQVARHVNWRSGCPKWGAHQPRLRWQRYTAIPQRVVQPSGEYRCTR